jgi:hypothetical protein
MVNILPLVKKISTISSPTHIGQFILTLALRIDFLFRRPDLALFKMDPSKRMSSLSDPLNIHDWVERYFKLMPHGGAPPGTIKMVRVKDRKSVWSRGKGEG